MLRKQGETVKTATDALHKLSVPEKNELLWQKGINFNELPQWQKRGVGLYWEMFEKPGVNPLSGEPVSASRRRVKIDTELPMKDQYGQFVATLIETAQ